MEGWRPRRASAFGLYFADDLLNALGEHHYELWDETLARDVEEVLCGASRHRLDYQCPANEYGLRIITVPAQRGLPGLRIAFEIDDTVDDDEGLIVYFAVRRLEPDEEDAAGQPL